MRERREELRGKKKGGGGREREIVRGLNTGSAKNVDEKKGNEADIPNKLIKFRSQIKCQSGINTLALRKRLKEKQTKKKQTKENKKTTTTVL